MRVTDFDPKVLLFVVACSAPVTTQTVQVTPTASGAGEPATGLEIPPSRARRLPPPPAGCRQPLVRAMPHSSVVVPSAPIETRTEVRVAADRLVVFQTPDGEAQRGEMFDPKTDTWTPIAAKGAPRTGSFKEGSGPLGAPSYFAFEEWVIVLWFDGNHSSRVSGAVLDARHNVWHAMDTEGMPDKLGYAIEVGTAGTYVRLDPDAAGGLRYDVRDDRWSAIPDAKVSRTNPATAARAGRIFVWGGVLGETPGSGATLDLETNRWGPMSDDGAPSGRYVVWSEARDDLLVTWSGTAVAGQSPSLRDGGIYDMNTDRWTPIPEADAPDPIEGVHDVYLDWTGEALLYRELSTRGINASPRRLAFFEPNLGGWWRTSFATHAHALPLAFGRVLLLDPAGPRVVHPREKLECPITLPAVPAFANLAFGSDFVAIGRIGDELVMWGRIDAETGPTCPPGAPCLPATTVVIPLNEGAVLSP